ncbi:hypothetical protein PENNAL_c0050G11743 [Penicillium nalgiovense]|uniref:Uncharacterized protein n=1 Tax=Penicillium nalgiovense TaxID=60175 RepID=A0A1V6XX72_PENNA|nr:hypothetical protein PENNAL_c0050G11743 [Penicillium nalgiovense]
MAAPTFLAKHPAYLRYVREVASGELDENNLVIIQVGEQYCRYPGCTASDHPYLTGNLREHVGRHSEDLRVAEGVLGRISYIEQEKVRAWYNSLFPSVPDSAPSSTSPSVTNRNAGRNPRRNFRRNNNRNVHTKIDPNA